MKQITKRQERRNRYEAFFRTTEHKDDKSSMSIGCPDKDKEKMDLAGSDKNLGFEYRGMCPSTMKPSNKPCTRCLSFFRGLVHALVLSGFFWWMTILFLAKLFD